MAGEGGGVFGSRGLGKDIVNKSNKKYTITDIHHIKSDEYFQYESGIIGEFKKIKKKTFKGAYVATLKSGNDVGFIIGYDFVKKDLSRNPKITPSKIDPPFSWGSGGETLNILATNLVAKGGTKMDMDIYNQENIDCKVFGNANDLVNSIMEVLKVNSKVSPQIVQCMDDYFKGNLIDIDCGDVALNEQKQIAKYIGELIFGIAALSKNKDVFSQSPWADDMGPGALFCVPLSSSFKGVDSVLIGKGGCQYAISSKSAAGAKPSFQANVMTPHIVDVEAKRSPKTYFTEMCIKKKQNPKATGPKFGYLFINDILGTKLSTEEMLKVYDEIKVGLAPSKFSKETKGVIELVRTFGRSGLKVSSPTEANIKATLPHSVTAFLGREIANKLMSDQKAVDRVQEVIAGKDFYQVNLDLAKFLKGTVFMKVTKSTQSKFKLFHGKGVASDVSMGQGFLNYELK